MNTVEKIETIKQALDNYFTELRNKHLHINARYSLDCRLHCIVYTRNKIWHARTKQSNFLDESWAIKEKVDDEKDEDK